MATKCKFCRRPQDQHRTDCPRDLPDADKQYTDGYRYGRGWEWYAPSTAYVDGRIHPAFTCGMETGSDDHMTLFGDEDSMYLGRDGRWHWI